MEHPRRGQSDTEIVPAWALDVVEAARRAQPTVTAIQIGLALGALLGFVLPQLATALVGVPS